MRQSGNHYFFGCAVTAELAKDLSYSAVLNSRCELSVGKSTCAALAELNVRIGIKHPVLPKGINAFRSLINPLTTLDYQRLQACPCKHQRSEHSRRPEADNNRSKLRRSFIFGQGVNVFFYLLNSRSRASHKQRFFVAVNGNIDGKDEFYIILLP